MADEDKGVVAALRARCEDLEARLVHADRRFSLVLEATNDGVWDWDLLTDEVMFSRRWKAILGYEEHEVEDVSSAFFALIHPDDQERVGAAVQAHFERRAPYDVELRMKAKDGSYRMIRARGQAEWDASGRPLRMAGTHTDVTDVRERAVEQVRTEELLELQRETIRALSTPILELGDGVLCVPIIGAVNDERAATMTNALLDEVSRSTARAVVVDLTGAEVESEGTLEHLTRMLRAVALLGARGLVCGIKPELAQRMVEQGVAFGGVAVLRNLGEALRSLRAQVTGALAGHR